MKKPSAFFIPQTGINIGYGHLFRILNLLNELKSTDIESVLCLNEKLNIRHYKTLYFSSYCELLSLIKKHKPAFIIMDFFNYPENFIKEIPDEIILYFIDKPALSKINNISIYLNPLTPLKYKYLKPFQFVYEGLEYLPLNPYLKQIKKIKKGNGLLISFGNSDPNKLTLKILKYLEKINPNIKLQVSLGKYFPDNYKQEIIVYLKKKFKDYEYFTETGIAFYKRIENSDKVITSFGLTAIESLLLKKTVGLYNNSLYHTGLSKNLKENFFIIGTYRLTFNIRSKIKKFLNIKKKSSLNIEKKSLKTLFKKIRQTENRNCPVCGSEEVLIILNQIEKTIYCCKRCGSKFLSIKKAENLRKRYDNRFFFEEYKKKYGRTYIEDRATIEKISEERLQIIEQLKPEKGKILDVGSAFGFFLNVARERGWEAMGVEINKYAVTYTKKNFGIDCICGDFLKVKFKEKFDVITFWYTIEHFKEIEKVIKKITTILKPGGLLCLGIPNGNGALYKFARKKWLKLHPEDHYIDFSIKGAKIFFKKYNFFLLKKIVKGIHPERIGLRGKLIKNLASFIIKLTSLGDTMELYFIYSPSSR